MRRALLLVVLATAGLAAQTQSPPPPLSGQIPPQLLEFESRTNRIAIELASEPIAPISLDADGSRRHGVLYDRIMLGSLAAKRMIAEGKTPSPEVTVPGSGVAPNAHEIVAHPVKCGDRLRVPKDIVLFAVSGRGGQTAVREVVPSESLEAVIAALEKPAEAMVVAVLAASLINARVEITYEGDACPGEADPVSLPITFAGPRPVRVLGVAALPPEASTLPSPTVVRIQFYADPTGKVRLASLATGPAELLTAAVAHASQFQIEPARANGTPVTQSMTVQVSFTTAGPSAPRPPAPPPGPGDVTMSSNGPLGSGTTPGVPGLSRANSACAMSDDPNFGTTPQQPIKVGGGMRVGPARERQYLVALRGPEGQGVTFRREGSLRGPEGIILDKYALKYAGAQDTISLFLDEYRWDELKAPAGLVCAQPFGLKRPDEGGLGKD